MINEDIKNASTFSFSSLNKSPILIKTVDTSFSILAKIFASIAHSNDFDAFDVMKSEIKRLDEQIKSTKKKEEDLNSAEFTSCERYLFMIDATIFNQVWNVFFLFTLLCLSLHNATNKKKSFLKFSTRDAFC